MKIDYILIAKEAMPKTDSFNEPMVFVSIHLEDGSFFNAQMTAKTIFHWNNNFPNIPIKH